MSRKFISFLTVLVMILSMMMPMQVFGEDEGVSNNPTVTEEETGGVTAPGDPAAPETPDDPATPGTPGDPAAPGTPGDPAAPGTPDDPATPGTPDDPATPGTPGDPAAPGTPDDPAAPETPGDPAAPGTPGDPAAPGTPGDPAAPKATDAGVVTKPSGGAIVPDVPELLPDILLLTTPVEAPITISEISGVTLPVPGAAPDTTVDETDEFTATIDWDGDPEPTAFEVGTVYTATITVTPKDGYTLDGITENFFAVAGAAAANAANSGFVSVTFPKTAGAAPTFVEATTNESGDVVTLTFDGAMADPSADFSGFAVKANGLNYSLPVTATMAIASAALNTDPTKIDLTLVRSLQRGDIVTVEYVPGTITSADGGVLEAFKAQPVNNIVPVVIDSNLDGTWEAYDHVGWWGEVPYPTGDDWRGHEFNRHIYIDGNEVTFYGNGQMPFVDFLYLPNSETAAKGFTYDLDLVSTDWHTLEGGGFLFNADIDDDALSGYAVLFAAPPYTEDSSQEAVYSVKLFELSNVDVESMRNSTLTYNTGVAELASFPVYTTGTKHHINLETSADTLNMWDGDTQLIANYQLPNEYGNGVGLIGSYVSHGCSSLSYFTFSDLKIQGIADLSAVVYGTAALLNFTTPDGARSVVVEQSADGVSFTKAGTDDPVDASSTTATVRGLSPGQTYYFRLVIDGGKYDGYSRVATATIGEGEIPVKTSTHHHHDDSIINKLRFVMTDTSCYLTSGSAIETAFPMDVKPIIVDNRAYLPIRYVVEPLGGEAVWNQEEQKATITLGDTKLEVWVDNNTALINGNKRLIDLLNSNIKPILVDPSRVMLPVDFISEALNCNVNWYKDTDTIIITDW